MRNSTKWLCWDSIEVLSSSIAIVSAHSCSAGFSVVLFSSVCWPISPPLPLSSFSSICWPISPPLPSLFFYSCLLPSLHLPPFSSSYLLSFPSFLSFAPPSLSLLSRHPLPLVSPLLPLPVVYFQQFEQLEQYVPRYLVSTLLWAFSGDSKMKSREQVGEFIRSVTTIPLPSPALPIIDYEVRSTFAGVCNATT